MRIYLIGFMASGKSTLGKKLARRLGLPFFDLDSCIEHSQQLFIPVIFKQFGEEQFRLWEQEELHRVSQSEQFVMACGGGCPCFFDNMDFMLNRGIVIYIKMSPGQLESRLHLAKVPRPLMQNISKEERISKINELLAQREKYYSRAHLTIDGMNPDLKSIVEEICHLTSGSQNRL